MTPVLSPNTQAILLLTAPLIAGRGTASSDLLSPGEYKRLARHLREIQCQPADLLSPDAAEILRACQPVIDEGRLQKLLGRGFLLSQVIERWQARAIWVVSRADAEYPRRLKARLREDAPAVLYGCGDMALLETGGLAVVGSRHVDDTLIDYTMAVGRLTARAGRTLVSGGAKGIDQAAMRGALEAGGRVCGVLADSLEKTSMNRDNRNLLLDGQLVLISPYDPSAGFNVGNAMQRNKLVYALADASLVVSSDLNKGGTWAGAVEQLNKHRFIPVYVRSTGESSPGLEALLNKGALSWMNPQDVDSFNDVFKVDTNSTSDLPCANLVLGGNFNISTDVGLDMQSSLSLFETSVYKSQTVPFASDLQITENTLAEQVFSAASKAILQLLRVPMTETEVADTLEISKGQIKLWLKRLIEGGSVEKLNKRPVRYVATLQPPLFGHEVQDD
jgi:predicted Rossmann fold nucleotide-binding protein DprA/Smf involved in DNA uptake